MLPTGRIGVDGLELWELDGATILSVENALRLILDAECSGDGSSLRARAMHAALNTAALAASQSLPSLRNFMWPQALGPDHAMLEALHFPRRDEAAVCRRKELLPCVSQSGLAMTNENSGDEIRWKAVLCGVREVP